MKGAEEVGGASKGVCLPQQEEGRKGWERMRGNSPLKRRVLATRPPDMKGRGASS